MSDCKYGYSANACYHEECGHPYLEQQPSVNISESTVNAKIDLDKLQKDTEERQSNYTFDGNVGTMKEEAIVLLKLLELIVEYECALEYYAFHHETLEPIKESTAYKALQEKKRILGE